MNFDFSDRYEPLFQLLQARSIVTAKDFSKKPKEYQDKWNELHDIDTVLISGGRDSGKSFTLSAFNIIAAKDFGHRILYTRQTLSSTDNSITEALENRMDQLGCASMFNVANKTYQLKPGKDGNARKGKISITGQKTSSGTQTAKLKSLEDFSIFETDEGEELESFDSWRDVKRSMRAQELQCLSIISFNPPTKEHWIAEELYEGVPDGFNGIIGKTLYIHTTYIDNGRENMAIHNWNEYEELREMYELYKSTKGDERALLPKSVLKGFKQYKYSILGGFKDIAEGVIYEDWEIGEFPKSIAFTYGLDFGSNDPDALTKVAVDFNERKIHIKEEYFANNTSTAGLMQILHEKVGTQHLIVADAAQRRQIKDYYHGMHGEDGKFYSGVNIRKVRKSRSQKQLFKERQIKTLQGFTLVITPDSTNVIKAVKNYRWHDKRAGVPNHDWSDLCDSWGYAAIDTIDSRG